MTNPAAIQSLMMRYPPDIQIRVEAAREWLLTQCPQLQEKIDLSAGIIGYQLGPGYKGSVCTLILSQKGVKLGLANSAGFDDPPGLLHGTGKVHRYVPLPPEGPETLDGLPALLNQALSACRTRLKT